MGNKILIENLIKEREEKNTKISLNDYILSKKKEGYIISNTSILKEYNADINNILPEEQMRELVYKYKTKCIKYAKCKTPECRAIFEKILNSVMVMIISEALSISKGNSSYMKDLIQAGTLAVYIAIQKFKSDKKTKFSTYALWRIRNRMYTELYKMINTIDIPSWIINKAKQIEKQLEEYEQEGKEENLLSYVKENTRITKRTIAGFQNSIQNKSINKSVGEEGKIEISDILTSPDDVKGNTQKRYITKLIKQYLEALPDREKNILIYRYGLFNNSKKTLEELGSEYGLSRERIRQIEEKMLHKLKEYFQRNGISTDELFI